MTIERKLYALPLLVTALSTAIPNAMATQRSYTAKTEFKRLNPCPGTGKKRGPCPGWEIDHITPLKCGGADTPANMQWLTIEAHKTKTRREARFCLKPPA